MSRFLLGAAILLVCVATAFASTDKVVVLDSSNFDSTIAESDLTLVEFFAPWCGHCKSLAPEYASASEELDGIAVLASVDCTVERDLCNQYEVRGFPTLKVFRNDGSAPSEYNAGRKSADIVQFMKKQKSPAYTLLSYAELEQKKAEESVLVLGFFADETSDEAQAFIEVAKVLRNDYTFGVVKDTEAAAADGINAPAVVLYKEEGAVTFTGSYNSNEIKDFVNAEAFPLVGDIGPDNYQKYFERGLPLVWVFVDNDASETEQALKTVTEAAKTVKGKLSVVKLDGVRWADHAKNFGLGDSLPGIVVESREPRLNYVFDKELTTENLSAHFKGFLDGTLTPTFKSEPIPTKNDGNVKVVVGKNWEEIVMDSSKDVMVEFYAPWCGHCKTLAPKYEKLGSIFSKEPNVVIAKIDGTLNDVPGVDINGFPTIYFYPANDKANPITYQGERNEKAMAKFIRENGTALKTVKKEKDSASHDEL